MPDGDDAERRENGMPDTLTNTMRNAVAGVVVQAGTVTANLPPVAQPLALVPRQIPAESGEFVNRVKELALLESAASSGTGGTALVVVSGIGGVGKTGLGVHWAHRTRDRFGGGQLYADLARLRHGGGTDVADVLGGFLRALGAREEWIDPGIEERAALFRTLTADRSPMLVLLDNVAHAAQVESLLPGAPGSVVVAVSRRRLTGLVTRRGAVPLDLGPLDDAEGGLLIERMVADRRVTGEPGAAAELARMCGGLPIALRVCGARLVTRRRQGIGRLSAELADEERRLERLTAEGKPVVEAVFDAAYADLPPEAAALYRGLGAFPGPDFSAELCDLVTGADGALDALLESSLLEEVDEDRYRFHDLVRLHAQSVAGESRDLRRRFVAWYLREVQAADWAVLGRRLRVSAPPEPPVKRADALGWLEREHANILAVVRTAAAERWDDLVWRFTESLWALYDGHAHPADELEVARLGLASARHADDDVAEARMHTLLVRALLRGGKVDEAAAELPALTALSDAIGARDSGRPVAGVPGLRVQAGVVEAVGIVRQREGDHEAAIAAFHRSRDINAALMNWRGIAVHSYLLGGALIAAGRHAQAVTQLEFGLRVDEGGADPLTDAKIRTRLGEAYLALGRPGDASEELTRALATLATRDMPAREARALELLAEATEDEEAAAGYLRRAKALRPPAPED
ncbi:tetratricopeptide repeat protein [Actinomadura harenae]|uniref:Tetratricopeptide repeat protein n=1 Tax=Actinomadura harenae TaxID=2483351 RepID=A0A3M2LME3_9ACTN|nr:tetratricopeptide repeat protein [Actinomadura harenae]RMI35928.1 tetratricopeptide repeat protein [Actinomadura harenae]